ncbi:DUF6081 family protein [Actinokineospora sp. NBRC 105648]|uniref:DUF6081 family protein n=1 Tax=Actinokineospora sp. NBRC 105648 TaxID=3032206 RepID=UPI0024A0D73F|nr:DUF6081 family protein [Actinokineospora sp. NBRC 105648]GLZ38908.1 hypothetical protein Acsp05_25320 [Actinokineospora sp. NBRC 105648]
MTDEGSYRVVWDDFQDGFRTTGPDARWRFYAAGPLAADDGVATTSPAGLRVAAAGTNVHTGLPAFTKTHGHDELARLGVPAVFDHVKWLVHANHVASTGLPGFDALPGHVLSFETWVSARSHGTSAHPFGAAVADPDDDLRLGAVALPLIDVETYTVVTFFLTNKSVYATYERLAAGRPTLGDYASFLYATPVATRATADEHHLKISYDRDAGTVRWFVDGSQVHELDRLGHLLPSREHMLLDHGGTPTAVAPRQLNGGMGMFTVLDGAYPGSGGAGLVRLDPDPGTYVDPAAGPPSPQRFLDDESRPASRLFGQGAELALARYVVSSAPR